jgi:hypothetical protein
MFVVSSPISLTLIVLTVLSVATGVLMESKSRRERDQTSATGGAPK